MTAIPAEGEAVLRRRLARHRAVATGLVAVMAAGAAATAHLPPGPWTNLASAATRAGFIGGIADWFAVTALFRRPLGLPIPHTAVIPRQKQRLGRALGNFLGNNVFTEGELQSLVARIDPAGAIVRALREPDTRDRLAGSIARATPFLFTAATGGGAGRALANLLPKLVDRDEIARITARVLRTLVEGGHHQEVVSFAVEKLREALVSRERGLRSVIEERVREQGGRFVGWALGGSIATRVLAALSRELEDADPEGSELRAMATAWIEQQIEQIEQDPARAGAIARAVRELFRADAIGVWGADVRARLADMVARDAARDDGHLRRIAEAALDRLADALDRDAPSRARLDRTVARLVAAALPAARTRLADFVEHVVAGWDDRMVVDKLELRVGRDLQYVRINGTLVGFLAGAAVQLVLGHV